MSETPRTQVARNARQVLGFLRANEDNANPDAQPMAVATLNEQLRAESAHGQVEKVTMMLMGSLLVCQRLARDLGEETGQTRAEVFDELSEMLDHIEPE